MLLSKDIGYQKRLKNNNNNKTHWYAVYRKISWETYGRECYLLI